MLADRVAIAELVLRVPGVAAADAPALVDAVLRRVHARLRGTHRRGRVELAELRVVVPDGLGRAELIDALADRIEEVMR
jgi:hypothetical protein